MILSEYTRQTLNWSHTRNRSQSRETGCDLLAGEAPPSNMMRASTRRVPSGRAEPYLQSPTAARNISGEKTTRDGFCCRHLAIPQAKQRPFDENCCRYGTATVSSKVDCQPVWRRPRPRGRCQFFQSHAATPRDIGNDATNMDKPACSFGGVCAR